MHKYFFFHPDDPKLNVSAESPVPLSPEQALDTFERTIGFRGAIKNFQQGKPFFGVTDKNDVTLQFLNCSDDLGDDDPVLVEIPINGTECFSGWFSYDEALEKMTGVKEYIVVQHYPELDYNDGTKY